MASVASVGIGGIGEPNESERVTKATTCSLQHEPLQRFAVSSAMRKMAECRADHRFIVCCVVS